MMRKVLELAKKSAKGEFFAFAMMISGWTNIQYDDASNRVVDTESSCGDDDGDYTPT